MSRLFLLLILCVAVSTNSSFSQSTSELKETPTQKLHFMLGEWQGEGWMMTPQGKSTTQITEKVACRLDCHMLLTEGKGTKIDPTSQEEIVVHDALGLITYDAQTEKYMIRAYKKEGVTESELELIDENILRWSMNPGQANIRFTIDFSQPNKWIETGEFSRDGENWVVFLQMDLNKI